MSDAMDRPPPDHGSDRYDYIEIDAPAGLSPPAELIARYDPPCGDCRANLFIRFVGVVESQAGDVRFWRPTIAHDDGCPVLARELGR